MTTIYQVSEDDLTKLLEKTRGQKYLSPKTAAQMLDVSPKTLAKWADKGLIKRYYFPKHKLAGLSQIVRYLESELIEAGSVDPEI